MKKLAVLVCLGALESAGFAQGSVNFFNTATTLTSAWQYSTNGCGCYNFVRVLTSGPVGTWFYGLLIAPPGTTDPTAFSFSGAYATNSTVPGRFFGGTGVTVTGWAPGASMSYEVAIWSASSGHDWQPRWLRGDFFGEFGLSSIATGVVGGGGSPPVPPYNLFGGLTGIQTGFSTSEPIPEPSGVAVALSGAALLLQWHDRKLRLRKSIRIAKAQL